MTGLLIDLDGVLYESDRAIPGAAKTIAWIKRRGIPHLFVTNTTSRPRRAIVDRLAAMGIEVTAADMITPPVAAAGWIREHAPGPAALFVAPATVEEFEGIRLADEHVNTVVVGDYGERWDFAELNRAFRLLMAEPRPRLVALGMTRYWLADDGLRLDTAPFVAALSHASGTEPVVLGKPSADFFASALARLGLDASAAVMIGDDIRGDIDGARSAGLRGVLVRTGKFREADLQSDAAPDVVLDSIADLPARWDEIEAGNAARA